MKNEGVAGLGSIDHYKDLAEAGADEIFLWSGSI